jgi:methylthioribose-1-phosphate isomerase
MSEFKSIQFKKDKLILIDQTVLPLEESYIETDDYNRIALSIERLEVRGAPAIGVTAAYAVALAFKNSPENPEDAFAGVYDRLAATRPTAVNLFWALDKMKEVFNANKDSEKLYEILLNTAKEIHEDDVDKCNAMGRNGLEIFPKKSVVLTHCNTGQLATGGSGTAFSVILEGFKNGLVEHVYADETRPLLQGSRLTAFELDKAGIPFSVNTDSMAAELMQKGRIDLVITGADRVAKNGDSANKIGTYSIAVLAKYHGIPFYIAAPTSTIDLNCPSGNDINIEQRDKSEVNRIKDTSITRQNYNIYSPAFDVTPAELIHGIITEEKLHKPPYDF